MNERLDAGNGPGGGCAPAEPRAGTRVAKRLARWAVGVAAVGVAGWMVFTGREQIESLFRLAAWRVWAMLGLFFFQFVASVLPLVVILRRMGAKGVPASEWMKLLVVSRFANLIVPQAGTAYKAVSLNRRHGVSYTTYIHAYALLAWMSTVQNLALASVFSWEMLASGTREERALGIGLTTVALGVTAAPFAAIPLLRRLRLPGRWLARVQEKAAALVDTLADFSKQPRFVGVVLALGFVRFGIWILFFRIALAGMDVDVRLAHLALFLAIWQLSKILIITPGNLGVQEVVYGVVGGAVGIGAAPGVMVSALIRAAQYLVILPLGLAFGGWQVCKRSK